MSVYRYSNLLKAGRKAFPAREQQIFSLHHYSQSDSGTHKTDCTLCSDSPTPRVDIKQARSYISTSPLLGLDGIRAQRLIRPHSFTISSKKWYDYTTSYSVYMWELWWTKRHWDGPFFESFGFPPSVSFNHSAILTLCNLSNRQCH
jgi:hypothetical protein